MTQSTTLLDIDYVNNLIKGIRIAMMTSICKDGSLRSRPLASQSQFDGGLWFFVKADPARKGEVEEEGQVSVTYKHASESIYVSLSGLATLVQDRQQVEKLWNEELTSWFPEGINDPQLALLRVDVCKWTYWDAMFNRMSGTKGSLNDAPAEVFPDTGEHRRVDLSGIWVSQDVGTSKTRNQLPFSNPAPEAR